MTPEDFGHAEFEHLIASYGATPARWPANLATCAQAFISAFPDEAREIMATEMQLDEALGVISAPAPSDLLKKRILSAATIASTGHPAKGGVKIGHDIPVQRSGLLHWRSVAALMLAAFGLGFGGAQIMTPGETPKATVYAAADTQWQSTADDLGLSDTYAWVEGDISDGQEL